MSIKSLDAATAYSQALKSGSSLGSETAGTTGIGLGQNESAFASLIEDTISDVSNATKTSELTSAKAIAGQADMVDVVTSISNAELVVSTMTAVRDKVVQAYQTIIKLPI